MGSRRAAVESSFASGLRTPVSPKSYVHTLGHCGPFGRPQPHDHTHPMKTLPAWLRGMIHDKPFPSSTQAVPSHEPRMDLLELARKLARDGHLHDAAREYTHLARRHGSPEIWLEHAELLLDMGDTFGAASNATRVLEVEPTNARALAVRRAVLENDKRERS